MATTPATTAVRSGAAPNPVKTLAELQEARRGTLALVDPLSEQDLERVHSPIMSPLAWDLGHIAAYEDLWLAHRHGGRPLLRPDLADLYDAFETPRAVRGEIDALGPGEARAYLQEVRSRTVEVIAHEGVGDGFIVEMVLRHELQHSETMRQTMALADLLSDADRAAIDGPLGELRGEEWLEVPAGGFQMGAGPEAFAYDNERPRHAAHTEGFRIARNPVSAESWMRFSDGGGYEQREWWSAEGWAWKQEHRIGPDPALAAIDPKAPACHISWFEADAFARAHGARLPSEAEWERAASTPRCARRDRPGLGVDPDPVPRLPRLRGPSLPRVLRGLLRRRLPCSARQLLGHQPSRREPHLPQLGSTAAAPDLRRVASRERRGMIEAKAPAINRDATGAPRSR